MTNIINNTYNQANILHKTNLQNIQYLQTSLQNKNNIHNKKNPHICLKDELHIVSINKNNNKNKKYFHIYDENENNNDNDKSVIISINKVKNVCNNKKYNSNIICINDANESNGPTISIPYMKSKRMIRESNVRESVTRESVTRESNVKKINICIDDPNEITTISIPYIKNRIYTKNRCNDFAIEISDIESECNILNIPTISINEKQYNILKQLDFFVKHKVIPDFVSPYNHKNYHKINKNIDNGLFEKYLYIVDNKKYKNTALATIVKETLKLIKKNITYDIEIDSLNKTIFQINEKLVYLEKHCNDKNVNLNIKTELSVAVSIDKVYVIYIQKYGLPDDGIFDDAKLRHIRDELEENHSDC